MDEEQIFTRNGVQVYHDFGNIYYDDEGNRYFYDDGSFYELDEDDDETEWADLYDPNENNNISGG